MRILTLLIAIIGISDIQGQVMLSAQQVERLEAGLLATPTDFGSRLRLLRYYSSTAMPSAQAIEYRRRHLLWLIRNHPEEEFLGTSMGLIFRKEDRLADPRGYLEAAGIWRKNISAKNVQAMTLVNSAEFFATEDREYAVTILNTGLKQFPGHQRLGNLKGSISALIVTGAGKVDQNGLFSSFTLNALQTEASIQSQRELGLQQDSNVLIGAASCIAQQYYEFQTQDNAAARELFALAEVYVARAHRLQPNNPQLQFAIANLYLSAANSTLASEEKVHLLEFGAVLLTLPQPRSILLAALAEAHFDNRQFDAAALNSKEVLAIAAEGEPISPAYSFDDSIH